MHSDYSLKEPVAFCSQNAPNCIECTRAQAARGVKLRVREGFMQVRVRVRRWVMWWFYVGVFCGGIALANIFGRDLTRAQERVLLLIGVLHWLLGGVVCWAF